MTRPFLMIAAAALTLSACASATQSKLDELAGPGNVAAMDAAAMCDMDKALSLALAEENSTSPSARLFSKFAQAAIYTDTGQPDKAAQAIIEASDPSLNPKGLSREQMQASSDAVLEGIRGKREDATGSRSC